MGIEKKIRNATRMSTNDTSSGYHLVIVRNDDKSLSRRTNKVTSSDSCCLFRSTDEFAAAPPQRVRTVVVRHVVAIVSVSHRPSRRHHRHCHRCPIPSPVAPSPSLSSSSLSSLRHRRCRRPLPSSYYHTNTTGGWQHQISQARAVHAHAPTYVPAVADHFCLINSGCHRRG